MRRNDKKHITDYDNSIQKSNVFSLAKMSYGLSLSQTQLLALAIFATQQNGLTEFRKADFEKKFGSEYRTAYAQRDSRKMFDLAFSIEDEESERFIYQRVFQYIEYNRGTFLFEWSKNIVPYILELKENYATIDLTITAKFRSAFSWTLYDFIKSQYGAWYKTLSKRALMTLFSVEHKKTYNDSTTLFRKTVLDVAIAEVNEHSELNVWYVPRKTGRAITHFELHWSVGKVSAAATKKQVETITTMLDSIERDMWDFLELVEGMETEELVMMQKIKSILKRRKEVTADMTSAQAKSMLQDLRLHIASLHNQVTRLIDAQAIKREDIAPFYNWLEERD